jgi:RNA 2',3'-cyclic 3'-phosphodiesterase
MNEEKRLFFAFEIHAPWPEELPPGRVIDPKMRHCTIAFLGNHALSKLDPILKAMPRPSFKIGLAGKFERVLFLPKKRDPNVVAWEIAFWEKGDRFASYADELITYLQQQEVIESNKKNESLAHVTIARRPFEREEWEANFQPLPTYLGTLHLFESLGHLTYRSVWSHPILPPFDELPHTADLAYKIRGESIREIYLHALLALTFEDPRLLKVIELQEELRSLDEVIAQLNRDIGRADAEIGSSFKAVSYFGELRKLPNQILEWEMIVDV